MFDRELKAKRAYYNALDYAKQEAKEEGKEEGKLEVAKALRLEGFPDDKIASITGLTLEQIKSLSKHL